MKILLADISTKYHSDFPPQIAAVEPHKSQHDNLEVIKTQRVADQAEYEMEMARYLQSLEENELNQIKEFILHRVAFVIGDFDSELAGKILKQNLAQEGKRKMCLYSSENDGSLQWSSIKQRRLNPFGGCGPGASKTRIQTVVETYEDGVF